MLVTANQEAGVLEEQEEQMLHRVFGFADLTAGQVMIPRTELVAVAPTRHAGAAPQDRPGSRPGCRSTARTSTM
jgi:CBS domain containing-hemolysin-like protein